MNKSDVAAHFGNASKAAAALGVSRAAFSCWPEEVPKLRAYQVEVLTGGQLMADREGDDGLPGSAKRRGLITIKGKRFMMETNGQQLSIRFIGQSTEGWLRLEIADTSMTIYNNQCYLDTGAMLFGPLDNEASRQICDLIAPWVGALIGHAMEA